MQTFKWSWSLILAGAVVTAACGDSSSSLNPTAPSAVSADTLSAEAGGEGEYSATGQAGQWRQRQWQRQRTAAATETATVEVATAMATATAISHARRPTPARAPTAPVPPGKAKVEIEGLITAVGGGSITVRGQVVTVTPDTVIRHGNRRFEFSDLRVGDRVHVSAARVTSTGSGAPASASTLEAQEIKLQNPGDGDDGEEPSALVSVAAFDASASETGANPGSFRLDARRHRDATRVRADRVVHAERHRAQRHRLRSRAAVCHFPAGQATVDVVVTPIADALAEGSETVILTLTTVPAPFELGSPIVATVDLSDGVNPLVSVTASDPSASESGDTGTFTFTRTGAVSAGLAVTVQFSGSATPGFDYAALPTTVNFLAGQATAT